MGILPSAYPVLFTVMVWMTVGMGLMRTTVVSFPTQLQMPTSPCECPQSVRGPNNNCPERKEMIWYSPGNPTVTQIIAPQIYL